MVQRKVGNFHVVGVKNTFVGLVTIPARHVESDALAFISKCEQANVTASRRSGFRINVVYHRLFPHSVRVTTERRVAASASQASRTFLNRSAGNSP